jgi:hypothetical protein
MTTTTTPAASADQEVHTESSCPKCGAEHIFGPEALSSIAELGDFGDCLCRECRDAGAKQHQNRTSGTCSGVPY